ncbi:hypothetical protein PENNAL_c0004G00346 [Penicillium nalgiovense]|uniref:Major facilitator superfamily (MFS) profile domain-containing protein n=2 Tax=Penicillium nalgiovense TaxID=60175 RepID=A0A1V6Z424_PENNA|nr:hypothetical protein PENNAL_c0004G00346 [Penicillium nalgiovense]
MGDYRGKDFLGSICGRTYTAGLTLLVDTIESDELGSWISFGLSGMNFGVLVSPTLGGNVYEHTGYYPVFIMGLCVILVNLVFILLMIDRKSAANASGKRRLSRVEDGDPTTTTPLLGTCSVDEKYPSWWTIFGGFLRNHRISAALYGCLINTILVSAMDAILPIFIKQTFHWFSGATGALFLNLTTPSLIGPVVGMISEKHGARLISGVSFTLAAVAVAALALIQHDDTSSKVMACVPLSFVGIGLSTSLTPLAAEIPRIVNTVQEERPDIYGDKIAVTEAYMLLAVAFGAGTVLDPLLSELAFGNLGWTGCTAMLGLLSMSAIVPVVVHLAPNPKDL